MRRPGDESPEPEGGRAADRLREFEALHITTGPKAEQAENTSENRTRDEAGNAVSPDPEGPSKL